MSDPAEAPQKNALMGAMYAGSDGAMTCALCDHEMEWDECQAGCEAGFFDAYEDDPNYYQPGELKPCHDCEGEGGSWWCATNGCPTQRGYKLMAAKPTTQITQP